MKRQDEETLIEELEAAIRSGGLPTSYCLELLLEAIPSIDVGDRVVHLLTVRSRVPRDQRLAQAVLHYRALRKRGVPKKDALDQTKRAFPDIDENTIKSECPKPSGRTGVFLRQNAETRPPKSLPT